MTSGCHLPALPEHRMVAAEIFALLSSEADDGTVTATIDDVPVELYAVKPLRLDRASS